MEDPTGGRAGLGPGKPLSRIRERVRKIGPRGLATRFAGRRWAVVGWT